MVIITEAIVFAVKVATISILRATLSGVYTLCRWRVNWNARLIVIAGAVIVAVVVAALGIRGADGTRPHTPGRRIDRLVVVAATVVLAVPVTALGVRGAGPARRTTNSAAAVVLAAARNLHEGEGQGQRTED